MEGKGNMVILDTIYVTGSVIMYTVESFKEGIYINNMYLCVGRDTTNKTMK